MHVNQKLLDNCKQEPTGDLRDRNLTPEDYAAGAENLPYTVEQDATRMVTILIVEGPQHRKDA